MYVHYSAAGCKVLENGRKRAAEPQKSTAIPLTDLRKRGIIKATFETAEAMQKHYAKHCKEYDSITAEEYLLLANKLANAPISEDVEKFVRSDGSTSMYRFSTNDFLVITKDGNIRTFFKPKAGKEYWVYEHERN